MKKFFVISISMICLFASVNAQTQDEKKLFQNVTAGVILANAATFSIGEMKPASFGTNLFSNVTIVTPYTFHNIMYGFGDNSVSSLNGYFLKDKWDVYTVYAHKFSDNTNYLGVAIEKMMLIPNAGEGLQCFIFCELGTDFNGGYSATLGLLLSVQHRLWGRVK